MPTHELSIMRLEAGTRIGAFEILAAIGAGGMGEVYRARDTRLGRDVALKILPAEFAADPARLARFRREAQVLASLNHPRIAAIYGIEERERQVALALEFVDGDDLAVRIARGRLPVDEAIAIARQIAEGLEAAHERGIVHRDLKPANVKVTPDGAVKLLDFGLAKAYEGDAASSASSETESATLTRHATEAGVVLGTAAYMSPEQARGRPVDKRSDNWAFGVLLYELLTGTRLFSGDTASDTIANVLTRDVDYSALPAETPADVIMLIRRTLDRDVTRRLRDIGEARIVLGDTGAAASGATRLARPRARVSWRALAGVVALVAAGSVGAWMSRRQPTVPASMLTLGIDAGTDTTLAGAGWAGLHWVGPTAVISPDGTRLVFIARGEGGGRWQLYARRLDELRARALQGTEDAVAPFFSPDGHFVGFFARGELKKVALDDGTVTTIGKAEAARGGAWAEDGTIVFAPRPEGPLYRVPFQGGTPAQATKLERGEISHRWPSALPGHAGFLFTAQSDASASRPSAIVAWNPADGTRTTVLAAGLSPRYVPTGHLLYVQEGRLFGVPFDPAQRRVTGAAALVTDDVADAVIHGGAQFSVSDTGLLVYRRSRGANRVLQWMDSAGQVRPLRSVAADYRELRLSADQTRACLVIGEGAQSDIWIYDAPRDTMTRLTFHPDNDWSPIWSPDERHIVYGSWRQEVGAFNLFVHRTDGSGEPLRLTTSRRGQLPVAWHPDGRHILVAQQGDGTGFDQVVLPVAPSADGSWTAGPPQPLAATVANELAGEFSPDGRWVAYVSDESGRSEVYVQPFPGPGGRWQVSTGGAEWIEWRTNDQLLYGRSEEVVMAVPYRVVAGTFVAGKPQVWMRIPQGMSWTDPARDGTGAAVIASQDQRPESLVLVVNFLERLRSPRP